MQTAIVSIIEKAKTYIDTKGGLRSVYFVGCGGSWAAENSGCMLLESENTMELAVGHWNSSEFVHTAPKTVNDRSIVIVTSMKATAESVEALRIAKARGAFTIAVTGWSDTMMAQTADAFAVYTHSDHWTCALHSQAIAVRLSAEILRQFEGWSRYDAMTAALNSLNERYEKVKAAFTPRAIRFGVEYRNEKLFHVFSSGTMYGAGYGACYCHLMEMQQLNAIPINSAEYVHGFFEATVPEQPSIVFMNVGKTRKLDERALRFLKQFCDKLVVLDAAEYGLDDLDEEIAQYIAPLITSPLFRTYVEHLAVERRHPMTLRRYMWQFEY